MRLASFNVENLFDRAKALNLDDPAVGKPVLEQYAELSKLLAQIQYSAADRSRIAELVVALGMGKDDKGPFTLLRRNRGALLKRPKTGGVEVVAAGRDDWVGQVELRTEPINVVAMRSTARVINDVGADVMAVIEAESRPVLNEFSKVLLPAMGGAPYERVMVIDGNDDRGIDVGVMARGGFAIDTMRSHVDDRDNQGSTIFSRDCPEYRITTPGGSDFLLLVNHFKSKGFGTPASSNAKRRAQAARVAAIYQQRRAEGIDRIAILGDLNDTPGSAPLAPLVAETDLKDVSAVDNFDDGANGTRPGTFGASTASNKIDYVLLSPALFARTVRGGIFRKGMWPGVRPPKWPAYPEITKEAEAASDHGAIWADIEL